jgi:hypothetical protein
MVYKFLYRAIIFTSPIIAWIVFVYITDPFNYFGANNNLEAKNEKVKKVNSLLFNMVDFEQKKSPVVFIGDSRIKALNVEQYSSETGKKAFNFHSNAAKLNEIIDMFWYVDSTTKLEHVYLGLNFNQFNEFAYSNRVESCENIINNPFSYIFNRSVAEACFIYYDFKKLDEKSPNMTQEEFWNYNIQEKSKHYYGKYQFPQESFDELQKIASHCDSLNIKLTFIIVPHYIEMQQKVTEFHLENELATFQEKISSLAETINYDYDCAINRDKSNFGDPIHYNEYIGALIVKELSSGIFKYGQPIQKLQQVPVEK